jgi:hypothetical protein
MCVCTWYNKKKNVSLHGTYLPGMVNIINNEHAKRNKLYFYNLHRAFFFLRKNPPWIRILPFSLSLYEGESVHKQYCVFPFHVFVILTSACIEITGLWIIRAIVVQFKCTIIVRGMHATTGVVITTRYTLYTTTRFTFTRRSQGTIMHNFN